MHYEINIISKDILYLRGDEDIMEITYKTSKFNAYTISNAGLKMVKDIKHFKFEKTLILANSSIVDSDIIIITHGFRNGKIVYKTSIDYEMINYTEIAAKMLNFFPSLNKIELICCYNYYMKNTKKNNVSIEVSDCMRTPSEIFVNKISVDRISKCINILCTV